jgi:N-formylglutamate deformylase
VREGAAPLIIGLPHTGTAIPAQIEARMTSPWLARKDADWWVDRLYDFAVELDATFVRTGISRSVIDVNRDPSGVSLYPGMTTTGLCPVETFDGEPLYLDGQTPEQAEIDARRAAFFDPYHAALQGQIDRLRANGPVVLYDAHSIRSVVPRLFEGELPQFNIGDNGGATCDSALTRAVEAACTSSGQSHVVNGRFKGGWTTRHYGRPQDAAARHPDGAGRPGIHGRSGRTCRARRTGPPPTNPPGRRRMRGTLRPVLTACIDFAGKPETP